MARLVRDPRNLGGASAHPEIGVSLLSVARTTVRPEPYMAPGLNSSYPKLSKAPAIGPPSVAPRPVSLGEVRASHPTKPHCEMRDPVAPDVEGPGDHRGARPSTTPRPLRRRQRLVSALDLPITSARSRMTSRVRRGRRPNRGERRRENFESRYGPTRTRETHMPLGSCPLSSAFIHHGGGDQPKSSYVARFSRFSPVVQTPLTSRREARQLSREARRSPRRAWPRRRG